MWYVTPTIQSESSIAPCSPGTKGITLHQAMYQADTKMTCINEHQDTGQKVSAPQRIVTNSVLLQANCLSII